MNSVVIILGIVIIVLIYVLYKYYSNTASTLQSTQTSLNTVTPPITKLSSPTNTRYSYGIWLYVNSWDPNVNKTIFSRAGNLRVYLSKTTPTLNVDISMSDNTNQTMIVTDNFPLQKWVYIIVSVDNQFIDIYLDGKLVKSQRFYSPATSAGTNALMPKIPSDLTVPVFLGNSDVSAGPFTVFDAYIAQFYRWAVPMDPQTAWNYYMAGNGQSTVTGALSAYGANLQILQNNVAQSTYQLF
jgi:hypothetical protein